MLWALALALFVASGWIFMDARRADATADRLAAHAIRLGQELSEMGSAEVVVPTEAAFVDLANRVERLNTLTGERHTTLLVLLAALERALPGSVWVAQMSYSVENGAFAVSLLGETETDLPIALQQIEAIPQLQDVILERQVRVQSGTRNLLQYDIRAVAE